MQIDSIHIENYRRFESFDCDFDPRFTLIIGPNGAGKTSLLRAIFVGLKGGVGPFGLDFSEDDVRRVDTLDPGGSLWRTPVYPAQVRLHASINGHEFTLAFDRDALGSGVPDGRGTPQMLMDRFRAWSNPSASEAVPVFARFGATTAESGGASAGIVRPPFESREDVWRRANSDQIDVTELAQWFQYNELRTLQEGKVPLPYQIARVAVLSAIHAIDIRYIVRDNRLMVRHEEGWRSFDQLSDGQRRIAAIFCELALRCAALNSHLGENCLAESLGIVTIDELDLHLHPLWQRSIIGDLRRVFPKLQFIAASHSPFLLQAAYEYGKVLDVSTGQFVEPSDHSIEDIAESVMGVDQPQRSERFLELKRLSQEFYQLLETKPATNDEVIQLKEKLDHAMAAFANDPAAAAWLEQRRIATGH